MKYILKPPWSWYMGLKILLLEHIMWDFFAVMLINDICCRGFFDKVVFRFCNQCYTLFTEITWKFSLCFWSSFKYRVFAVFKSKLEFWETIWAWGFFVWSCVTIFSISFIIFDLCRLSVSIKVISGTNFSIF